MFEFIQNNWIWILLIGGMFLMHRLGIGCCGGHSHSQGHGHGKEPKAEPKSMDAKATEERRPEVATAARRGGGCH